MAPLIGSKIKLRIEKLAIGGAGVARHQGLVIFVPQAAPKEEVLAEVTVVKKNFAEARIVEILKSGSSRRQPPCKVASTCGGCNWQHLDEAEQRAQKESLVLETVRKFNPTLEFEYLPIKPSPKSLRYRNRIQPKFKNGQFGFFSRNSHAIVNITDCLIAEEPLVAKFQEAKDWARQNGRAQQLERLEMYITEEGSVRYSLIQEEDEGVGFSQVNRFQNLDLIETVLSWSGEFAYKNIFDLYAGAGNFTLPLAGKYPETPIVGVELNPKLVARARQQSSGSRVQHLVSDVEAYLSSALIGQKDLVILDPPRAGTSELIMRSLVESRAKKIIYVSCHPVSLSRDLRWFFAWAQKLRLNAKILRLQAFEMFPQTDHVETIAELEVDS